MKNVMASARAKSRRIRVGVDTGGTFTDFVWQFDNRLQVFKLPSTPADPSSAIIAGLNRIAELAGAQVADLEVVHGTTVGTNSLLQRRGSRVALVTTKGFEDVLVIGRQARPELYHLDAVRPPPLVPDSLRFGVRERVAASGEVLEALEDDQLDALATKLKAAQVESVAISLLFSFVHPEHESRIAESVSAMNIPVSVSHQILPEYREYERTSTVTINAYLQPLMGAYLKKLAARVPNLRVMQSSGGSISAAAAADEPVRTILSGPAGGVVGALRAARSGGLKNMVTFDMGGTSTDVALCDRGGLRMTNEAVVAGLPVAVSIMDIHTVGAGGGSIARVDEGGSLRVGPESAGADPGPACYGRSSLPTVTDAHVVLGHFGGAGLLGGEFPLDEQRAREALSKLAGEMSEAAGRKVSVTDAAHGVISVVNINMERALRSISVERGYDPRDFALLSFGGAGGLHAVDLARALRIPRVIAPTAAGALSAIGVVTADVVKDLSRTVMLEVGPGVDKKLEIAFKELGYTAGRALSKEGFSESKQRSKRSLAARYKGQSFELNIESPIGGAGNIAASFHRAHRARYGYAQDADVVEIVSTKLRSVGIVEKFKNPRISSSRLGAWAKPHSSGIAYFGAAKHRVGIYRRDDLDAGMKLRTPCIVTEYSATTVIPSGAQASIDGYGNLIIATKV
ncbi:hydantoinase/oxoprolinase family protein [soil metagenome]